MSSHYSFRFNTLSHRNQESVIFTILIAKEYNQYQSKGDVHRARSRRISNRKFLHSQDLIPSRHIEKQQYAEYCQPGKLTWALVSRTFIGVSLHRYIWQNHCPLSWTQYPTSLPSSQVRLISYDSKLPNPLTTWFVFLAWLVSILSHLISVNQGPSMINKITPILQEIPKI